MGRFNIRMIGLLIALSTKCPEGFVRRMLPYEFPLERIVAALIIFKFFSWIVDTVFRFVFFKKPCLVQDNVVVMFKTMVGFTVD